MSEKRSLILGPSNVGKTALLASFFHAVGIFDQPGWHLSVQPENDTTRQVQQNIYSFLQTGSLPFGGTFSISEYEFLFSVERENVGWKKWLNKSDTTLHRFRFLDAPGGTVFFNSDEEIDYAIQGEHRKRLIEELRIAQGIVICMDASELNTSNSSYGMSGRIYSQLNDIFSLVPKKMIANKLPTLDVLRVYVCLNKCDLWAIQAGYQGDALHELQAQNPLSFAYQLLGKGFFSMLKTWFSENTEIAVGFSSSYGFLEGGPNAFLVGGVGMGGDVRREHVESWNPYQVLEPFIFLTTGNTISNTVFSGCIRDFRDTSLWKM